MIKIMKLNAYSVLEYQYMCDYSIIGECTYEQDFCKITIKFSKLIMGSVC